ncbi:MAG TPA: hypothetical protein VL572_09195 [Pyrinomonadaceae bacterium]|nr:hypothetical protein [Pyrinomonadaceae bacterium]
MSMTINISARPENLHVVAAGEFSLDEAKRTFLEMLDAIQKLGIRKVLFDGRDITGEPLLIERFYYGQFAAEHVSNLTEHGWEGEEPQFAYVLTEPVLDWLRFGEMVMRNRGVNGRAFDNTEEAVAWLELGPEPLETTDEPN